MRWLKLAFLFCTLQANGQKLSYALEQINGAAIIQAGLTGQGVKVGIIDGGFYKADRRKTLTHLFERNQVAGYQNFVSPEADPYQGVAALDDAHGTDVWSRIAGLHPGKNIRYGLATQATFYLAVTDHGGYERRKEEEYAVQAIRWMIGEGVKIINISLGYNFGYDRKTENYLPHEIDGKSTLLTQMIHQVSQEHDVLFIVAAGNDGDNDWRIISSPGDAANALTVGATKLSTHDKMGYSSQGPSWLPYVKPEIACYSPGGTSFSTPVITGLAACLLEKDPTLSAPDLKQLIIESAQLIQPNNYIGYGVPDAGLALDMLARPTNRKPTFTRKAKRKITIPFPAKARYVVVYHLSNWVVVEKEIIRSNAKKRLAVKQKRKCTHSTVLWKGGQLEIAWE